MQVDVDLLIQSLKVVGDSSAIISQMSLKSLSSNYTIAYILTRVYKEIDKFQDVLFH